MEKQSKVDLARAHYLHLLYRYMEVCHARSLQHDHSVKSTTVKFYKFFIWTSTREASVTPVWLNIMAQPAGLNLRGLYISLYC